ncbi:2659_t:CDS:2, partial [Racocetra fulgida]
AVKNSESESGWRESKYEIKPATCGETILVPEIVLVAVLISDIIAYKEIFTGPKTLTHEPWLENQARSSSMVEAPIVLDNSEAAGEYSQAPRLSLPAATA